MKPTSILVIGTNKPIMETIARLIDKDGKWYATLTYTVQEALDACQSKDFSLVLMGAGLDEIAESRLLQEIGRLRPNLPVVKHYGGGSGLLFAEIYQALKA